MQKQLNQITTLAKFSTSCCIKTKVKNKKLSSSSKEWLNRHIKDPYVKKGIEQNYRARSAFKLLELNEKYRFLRPGKVVLDCGAAPGAWTQVAVANVRPNEKEDGLVISTDILNFFPVIGATMMPLLDFRKESTIEKILEKLGERKIDVCLSDMSPNLTGSKSLDHVMVMELVQMFYQFTIKHAAPGSCFLCKLRSGKTTDDFLKEVSEKYEFSKLVKPPSSRVDSLEVYLYANMLKVN